MYTIRVTWIDGLVTWDKSDRKGIAGYELDWAVKKVDILFQTKG